MNSVFHSINVFSIGFPSVFLVILGWILKYFFWDVDNDKLLPPGSLGLPYIGETFSLYSKNPNVYFSSKIKKFGSTFKTCMLGYPCVMISTPEAVKMVLVSRPHIFRPTFPESKMRILGKQAIFFHQGDYHNKLRRLVLRAFMPQALKMIVSDMDKFVINSVGSWEGRLINTYQEMKTYTFNVALLTIFGKDEVLCREDLKRCYQILEKGYNSMQIRLPGFPFYRAMKARKELAQIVAKTLCIRRQTKFQYNDLLESFMVDQEGFNDEQIADNIIGLIFAARDTTASVLTWVLKYLAENPHILKSVTEEHEGIIRNKKENGEEKGLTWSDTQKMTLTLRVIQETLRAASILNFTFREAVEDVDIEGYHVPKGWKVLPLFRNLHHSPENFPEPEKFDPSRFEVPLKPNIFLPFGSGIHSCPGQEMANMEISIMVHHLTTKYRWCIVGPQTEIQYCPFAIPQNGLPIKLSLRTTPIE